MDLNKFNTIITDGMQILQGYTPQELEAFQKGALYGAHNHKEINKRSAEWYEKHNAEIEKGKREAGAFLEDFKKFTGLGRAVENLKNMKTYEETRDEVLEKFIRALKNDPDQRHVFMALLEQMDKNDEELRNK